jgi:murein DD-endopeptidase MepM/ murein hydrolase activator NlpD
MNIDEKFGTETKSVFVPGVKISSQEWQEINGTIFFWPARGYITDTYGYRYDPFGGSSREFHNGMDISARTGTPVYAAMAGRVAFAGWSDSYGYYVVINHSGGYRTLYAHMSVLRAKAGAVVNAGERIGDVGSTGRSTGPHLHFTVYKNGVTINPRLLLQ